MKFKAVTPDDVAAAQPVEGLKIPRRALSKQNKRGTSKPKAPQVLSVVLNEGAKPKHPLAKCWLCPLYSRPMAGSHLPPDAVTAILSRSPGKHDTQHGQPFSGPSGAILDGLLKQNGKSRDNIAITNIVLCETDKIPWQAEAACRERLDDEIKDAKNLILCGAEAAEKFFPGKGVYSLRGIKRNLPDGRNATVTFNPAAALRNDKVYPSLREDFERAFRDRKEAHEPNVDWVDTFDEAVSYVPRIVQHKFVSVDIEATGLSAFDTPVSIGFAGRPTDAIVFGKNVCQHREFRNLLREIFSHTEIRFLWHNGQYDVKLLRQFGIENARVDEDTLLLSYSTDERTAGVHGLEYLTKNRLEWDDYESEEIALGKQHGFGMMPMYSFTRKKKKYVLRRPFDSWPELYKYNGYDVCASRALFEDLVREVEADGTTFSYVQLLIPGTNVLADVERLGIRFDKEKAHEVMENEVRPLILKHETNARRIAGESDLNLSSNPQCSSVIYDKFGLKDPGVNKKVKRSVDDATRTALLRFVTNPQARKFLIELGAYSKWEKIRNTYLEKLPQMVDDDGRLRGHFNLFTTETGRLSGTDPNLQNQPRGPLVRQCYLASEGHKLVAADYSQCELRTAAILSGDRALKRLYHDGRDLHSEVAAHFFGPNFDDEQRVIAKNVNFGIVYQQGAKGFSEMYGLSYAKAKKYIDDWFELFPEVRTWVRNMNKLVIQQQYLHSVTGRARRFHFITDDTVAAVQRQAVNFLVQGPASDFNLYSAIEFAKSEGPNYIVLLVHDNIIIDTPEEKVDYHAKLLTEIMEAAPGNLLGNAWKEIPFTADVKVGDNWGYMDKWENVSYS